MIVAGLDPDRLRSPLNSHAPQIVGHMDYVVCARQIVFCGRAGGFSMKPIPMLLCESPFSQVSNGFTCCRAQRRGAGREPVGAGPIVSRQGIHGLNARRFKI